MPVGRALKRPPRAHQQRFVQVPGDKLHRHRRALPREARGERDRRAAGRVEGGGELDERGERVRVLAEHCHLRVRR